jgi:hypothetical protein
MKDQVRGRPAFLRALGRAEPPERIDVDGVPYRRVDVFKHDSWAATALYENDRPDAAGDRIVCKFNRVQSIFGLPMSWLGRRLARRETRALKLMADRPGVPAVRGRVHADGVRLKNAAAHAFVPGHPLGAEERPDGEFFPELLGLLHEMHRRGLAYVDLHKRENVLVGDDGRPYLIDFQVCFGLWSSAMRANPLLRFIHSSLCRGDLYHLAKHVRRCRPEQIGIIETSEARPWWIRVHRVFAVPLRTLRRRLLTALGVRAKGGSAASEAFAEHAVRCESKRAA